MRLAPILALLVLAPALAGCANPTTTPTPATGTPATPSPAAPESYQALGFDGATWPRLDGQTLTILDHGAFGAFEDAAKLFENRTGAKLVHVEADDSGTMLARAAREKGSPTFDVIYGVDNVLWTKAMDEGVFEPYTPLLARDVEPQYVFFNATGAWPATPVDHGYIAVNVDAAKLGANVSDLEALRAHADQFVTEDPRASTPGLGFLLATIDTYGEDGWQAYWNDLLANGTLVTSGWTEAYEQHFSAGYGVDYGGKGDKPIVTSYTSSPAYEHYFGRNESALASVVTAPRSTFHQIQTMGIANGTKHRVAAEAWLEFALTPEFQNLSAPGNAVYPVVKGVGVADTYGGLDPAPGTFQPAGLSADEIGHNLEAWLREWTDVCEAHRCR